MTAPLPVSLVVTTYGVDTRYTQLCLERIARWKTRRHELIVVVHDASATMNLYLEYQVMSGLVDRLVRAPSGNGHVAGVNLGFRHARHEIVFNINTDVRVGPGLVDRCAARLAHHRNVGMIGWHYNWGGDHEATRWRDGALQFTLRTREANVTRRGFLDRSHALAIQGAPWNRGRVLGAVGDRRILCANTSFFGIRRRLWNRIGGFDAVRYPHYFSDDFLCYAVLEHGYDIENLPAGVRCSQRPDVFESLSDHKYDGIPEPERYLDAVVLEDDPSAVQELDPLVWQAKALNRRETTAIPDPALDRPLAEPGPTSSRWPSPLRHFLDRPRTRMFVAA